MNTGESPPAPASIPPPAPASGVSPSLYTTKCRCEVTPNNSAGAPRPLDPTTPVPLSHPGSTASFRPLNSILASVFDLAFAFAFAFALVGLPTPPTPPQRNCIADSPHSLQWKSSTRTGICAPGGVTDIGARTPRRRYSSALSSLSSDTTANSEATTPRPSAMAEPDNPFEAVGEPTATSRIDLRSDENTDPTDLRADCPPPARARACACARTQSLNSSCSRARTLESLARACTQVTHSLRTN